MPKTAVCPICGRNHQATEFVYAILLAALDHFITESDGFRDPLRMNGFGRQVQDTLKPGTNGGRKQHSCR